MRLVACFLVLLAWPADAARADGIALSQIVLTDRGVEPGGDFCRNFSLDAAQVSEFFERAVPVSSQQLHSDFDYLPCFVAGTARRGSEPVRWQIRAGGTGTVKTSGGESVDFGCVAVCDHLFRDQ